LKRSTRDSYKTILNRHLIPALGGRRLDSIRPADLQRYAAEKMSSGLTARTVNRQLNLLHLIYDGAVRQDLVRENPVSKVDRPKDARDVEHRWTILSPTEIGKTAQAFAELAADAETPAERVWIEQARVVFLTIMGAGSRRHPEVGSGGEDDRARSVPRRCTVPASRANRVRR
jgi:site-specific recombinase XerD